MNRKLISLALVSAGALAVALPATSHAYVMASAVLDINNFTLSDTNGQLSASDFSSLTFTSTSDQSADLSGPGGGSLSNPNVAGTNIDFAPICVGNGCAALALVDNAFPLLAAAPTTGNYAAADQVETGAPISGIGSLSSPARAGHAAYVGIDTGAALGSSTANNNLNSSFTFALNQGGAITFSFDILAWLQVAVTSDELFPGFATAATNLVVTIQDLQGGTGTVFTYSPDFFGDGVKTLSLNAPLPIDIQQCRGTDTTNGTQNSCVPGSHEAVTFTATTPALLAGNLYQLSIRSTAEADAGRVVPEPGMLALVGLGLLGMGLSRRRKAA